MSVPPRIGIFSIGSALMGDDGIGPFILKRLESFYEFPANVVLRDLGVPRPGIISLFSGYDVLILIEAVSAHSAPGALQLYRKPQQMRGRSPHRLIPRDTFPGDARLFAEHNGSSAQKFLLVGIVPRSTELESCLSPEVKAAVVPAMSAILAELHRLGVRPRPKIDEALPSIWEEENVVSESILGEGHHVLGYPG